MIINTKSMSPKPHYFVYETKLKKYLKANHNTSKIVNYLFRLCREIDPGIGYHTIRRAVNGESNPKKTTIDLICRVLDEKYEELF